MKPENDTVILDVKVDPIKIAISTITKDGVKSMAADSIANTEIEGLSQLIQVFTQYWDMQDTGDAILSFNMSKKDKDGTIYIENITWKKTL